MPGTPTAFPRRFSPAAGENLCISPRGQGRGEAVVVKAWRSRIPGGEVVEWAQAAPGTGCRASIAVRYGCEKAKAGFLGDSVPYSLRRELGALQGYYERRKPVSYYCLFTLYDDGLTGRHPHSDPFCRNWKRFTRPFASPQAMDEVVKTGQKAVVPLAFPGKSAA